MKKTILKIAVCALFAAPVFSRGQDSNTVAAPAMTEPPPAVSAPAAEIPAATAPAVPAAAPALAKPKKPRTSLAASGKVSNVDTNAMTLTVGKRTFEITSETRISKGGKPAILSDIAVDDKVGIAYKKADGKLNAVTIKDSVKPKKSDGESKGAGDQK